MTQLAKRLNRIEKAARPTAQPSRVLPVQWVKPKDDPEKWYVTENQMGDLNRELARHVHPGEVSHE